MRLDRYLFEKGLSKSRTHAQSLISSGLVLCDSKAVTKPSYEVGDSTSVEVVGEVCPYVSRGGMKLCHALKAFDISVSGKIAVDIGASTGGFTHVLLENGISKVYAVDSGHGQLDSTIASDSRVVSMEGFNARNLTSEAIGEKADVAVCDVSFISQTLIHKALTSVLREGGEFVGLIKPQFESDRKSLSKRGIVKDSSVREKAVNSVCSSLVQNGFHVLGLDTSPITGGDGNTEYLVYARLLGEGRMCVSEEQIRRVCR